MINVKDQVFDALSKEIKNVTDTYPKNWTELPAVQYAEEENKVYEFTAVSYTHLTLPTTIHV